MIIFCVTLCKDKDKEQQKIVSPIGPVSSVPSALFQKVSSINIHHNPLRLASGTLETGEIFGLVFSTKYI